MQIRFQTDECELEPDECEPSSFYTEIIGELIDDDDKVVGRLTASILRQEAALEHGVPLFDLGDSIDQETHNMWSAVMVSRRNDFRKGLECCLNRDVLYPRTMEILAAYRGRGLGHQLLTRLIDLFGSGCGLIVIEPHPLLTNIPGPDTKWKREMQYKAFTSTGGAAKLRRYWGKLGFKPVPASKQKYYYINPAER